MPLTMENIAREKIFLKTVCKLCIFYFFTNYYVFLDIKTISVRRFFCILILLITVKIKDYNLKYKEILLLSLLSIFFILMSYTAAFILFSCFITLLIYKIKNKSIEKDWAKKLLYYIIPLGIAVLLLAFINCLPTMQDNGLQSYWGKNTPVSEFSFLPKTFESIQDMYCSYLREAAIFAIPE